jgi:hypothetical protein
VRQMWIVMLLIGIGTFVVLFGFVSACERL